MTALLAVDELVAGYHRATVLRGVTLALESGTRTSIVGPNGAGKSTLLKTISGLVPVRAGSLRFDGADIAGWSPERIVRAGIVHVPEGRQVFPGLSVTENLWLGGYTKPGRRKALTDQVLALFPRLAERLRQPAESLSGGEQQMLAIGRGLMAEPRLLILDEPTLGLAPLIVDQVADALRNLTTQTGITLLVVEQGVHLTSMLCDVVHVLVNGSVSVSGPVALLGQEETIRAYMGAGAPAEAGMAPVA